jgi:hypothetical protein
MRLVINHRSDSPVVYCLDQQVPAIIPGTPEERVQIIVLCQSAFMAFQTSFLLDEQGALDTQIRDSITSGILNAKDTLGPKFFWAQRSSSYNKSLGKYVEELASRVEEGEGSTMYTKPT